MSLSWFERHRIALQPDAVTLAAQRAMRSSVAPTGLWRCEPKQGTVAWWASLKTLSDEVALGSRRSRVSLVLSNHYCHYALFSRPAGIAGESEAHAYVLNRMQALYGETVKSAELRLSPVGRRAWFACCIPNALIAQAREVFAAKRTALVSIQPYFAAAWNRRASAMRGRSGWFLVQEVKRLVAAYVSNGQWMHVASRRCADDLEQMLDVLDRERELLPAHHAQRTVWLYGSALAHVPSVHRDYVITVISAPGTDALDAEDKARYAMVA